MTDFFICSISLPRGLRPSDLLLKVALGPAAPGTRQTVSPTSDLLNPSVRFNKISSRFTCTFQGGKRCLRPSCTFYPHRQPVRSPAHLKLRPVVGLQLLFTWLSLTATEPSLPALWNHLTRCLLPKANLFGKISALPCSLPLFAIATAWKQAKCPLVNG